MATKTKKTSVAKKAVKVATQAVPATTVAPAAPAPVVKPAVVAPASTPAPAGKTVSAVERAKMIEINAYLLAEKNGFRGDSKLYWLQAEKDVDAKLGKK
jgi:hypothetical protein